MTKSEKIKKTKKIQERKINKIKILKTVRHECLPTITYRQNWMKRDASPLTNIYYNLIFTILRLSILLVIIKKRSSLLGTSVNQYNYKIIKKNINKQG